MDTKRTITIELNKEEKNALVKVADLLRNISNSINEGYEECNIINDDITDKYNVLGALDTIHYFSADIDEYLGGNTYVEN